MGSSPESSRRLFEFVGKAIIGTFVVFAVLELVFWAASSFGRWLRPDPRRADLSPAYAGAAWVPEFYREQSLRLQARYGYVPFVAKARTRRLSATAPNCATFRASPSGRIFKPKNARSSPALPPAKNRRRFSIST